MALIYVVEDDKSIQEIETFALKGSGYDVVGFDDAAQFFEAMQVKIPSMVLLDVMLPDCDGITIVKMLREREDTADIPIILVTAKTAEIDKVKGLDSGADDYLVKPFGVMELISRVKALLRRSYSSYSRKNLLTLGAVAMDIERHIVAVNGNPCELTYKEFELLKLLMSNAGNVTTRQMILDRVWGTSFEGESRSLDMHIKTLRQKLREEGRLIKTVRNVGYIMSTE